MAYLELTQAFSLTSFGGNRQRGAYRRIGNEGELEFLLSAGNAITIDVTPLFITSNKYVIRKVIAINSIANFFSPFFLTTIPLAIANII